MEAVCRSCHLATGADDSIACDGFCDGNRFFHKRCAGLTSNELKACDNANIFWTCDWCRELLEDVRFRNSIKALESAHSVRENKRDVEIAELKTCIGRLTETVNDLIGKPNPLTASDFATPTQEAFVPLSSTRMDNVSKSSTDSTNSFELFLSNISSSVSEQQVSSLVCRSLHTNLPFRIKKLVPAWKDTSTLEYVSFKIELDASMKNRALSPGTWPRGIRYREFRCSSSGIPWTPQQPPNVSHAFEHLT